jgi:tetratricopeptide (TPR) repeat protein
MRAAGLRRAVLIGSGVLLLAGGARAVDADAALASASREVESVRSVLAAFAPGHWELRNMARSTEQMIAAGEMALRAKDYEQAIDTFSQAVELYGQGRASPNAHAEALFLLAEAYTEAGQPLSARRKYDELLTLGVRAPYDFYAGRCLGRLVDVAKNTGRTEALDSIAAKAGKISILDTTGSLDYARGKLSFARGRLEEAQRLLGAVPPESAYHHQASYVLGAVLVRQALSNAGLGQSAEAQARLVAPEIARGTAGSGAAKSGVMVSGLVPALTQFQEVTRLPRDTAAHGQVIDQAWLAIGRLLYESERYLDAAQAYLQVAKGSPVYFEMLFELSWVYIRMGDYERAERALELLSVAAPDTLDIADGALLRADLMLRAGRFERALAAYEEVRGRFEPARERVQRFIENTTDPALYYDELVQDGLALGNASPLPEVVLDWVRDEARGERVMALIDDVSQAREVLRRARKLESKLTAMLGAPSRARAFPELKASLERTIGLSNQLARARRSIALGFDDVEASELPGKLANVRRERRSLMAQIAAAPVASAEFASREEQSAKAWNRVSQALQRATLETDNLQAVINGLRRVLDDADKHGVTRDRATRARYAAEVETNENSLAAYRAHIEAYRQEVENGRVQVGLGDKRYVEDDRVRRRFRRLQDEEVRGLSAGKGGAASLDYARSVAPVLAEVSALERRLDEATRALTAEVSRGSEDLSRLVAEEAEHIAVYTRELDALDQQARRLVGEVAMRNFQSVLGRLQSIVLRADVGIVQQAWELREEQQVRLRNLQRERAIEEQNLEDELREVFDDAGESP